MSEQFWRCRFWPHCAIHRGLRRPQQLSPDNRQDIQDLVGAGMSLSAVAVEFEVSHSTVSYIVAGTR